MKAEEIEVRRYLHHSLPTLRDLVTVVFRHWKLMLIVGCAIGVAGAVAGVWKPEYESRMKILVQSRRTDAVISSSSVSPVQFNGNTVSEEDLNSEVELLTGNDLLRKVAVRAGLVNAKSESGSESDEAAVAKATLELSRALRVEAVRKTHVISVRYKSRDAKRASAVLSTLAAVYIEKHAEVHRSSGEFSFFDQEAARFRQDLDAAQQRLIAFSQERNVVSAQSERDSALSKAEDFDSKANEARALIAETESRIGALHSQLNADQPRITTSVRKSDNPQLMGQLKSTLLNLQLKQTELLTKYDPGYPLVKEVERQIADTQASIKAEEHNPIRDETTDSNPGYQLIKDGLAKAEADLDGLKARAAAAETIAAQYRVLARTRDADAVVQGSLIRDAKNQEEGYLLFVRKSEEAGISDALDRRGIVNVAIAEEPQTPTVPERSPVTSIALTLLLAFAGSFTTAFAVDAMNPTFRTPDEVANFLQVPVLAALPKHKE